MSIRKFVSVMFAASLLGLLACTTTVQLDSTLENEGMQGLSTEDPFFGPNILLSKEMEQSNFLHSFVKEHGAPRALELEKKTFSDHKMFLYYPYEGHVYVAEPEQTVTNPQWIVRGPIRPHWKDQRRAMQLAKAQEDLPILYLFGRSVRYGKRFPDASKTTRVLQPKIPPRSTRPFRKPATPTPKPTPEDKTNSEKKAESTEVEEPEKKPKDDDKKEEQAKDKKEQATPTPEKKPTASPSPKKAEPDTYRPLNTDQQAILMSQGFAERAPNGDVIHRVVSPDESLALIALWYTGKIFHSKELASANQLSIDEPLLEGERITIPKKLVKQYKSMPDDFVFSDEYKDKYGPKS